MNKLDEEPKEMKAQLGSRLMLAYEEEDDNSSVPATLVPIITMSAVSQGTFDGVRTTHK